MVVGGGNDHGSAGNADVVPDGDASGAVQDRVGVDGAVISDADSSQPAQDLGSGSDFTVGSDVDAFFKLLFVDGGNTRSRLDVCSGSDVDLTSFDAGVPPQSYRAFSPARQSDPVETLAELLRQALF